MVKTEINLSIKPTISRVLDEVRMASQLFTNHVSSFLLWSCVCVCYNEIRQVFMVSICSVNTQEQHSIGVFSMWKKERWSGVRLHHHLGRGVRIQQRMMESFIQIPWGLAIEAKLSLTSKLIRSWNMSLWDPWLCINVVFICNQVIMIEYTKEARGEALLSHSKECF